MRQHMTCGAALFSFPQQIPYQSVLSDFNPIKLFGKRINLFTALQQFNCHEFWNRNLERILQMTFPFYFNAILYFCIFQAPDFYVEMKWEFTSWGELAFDEISNDISSDFFMQFCFFSGKLILIETFCTFQCLLCLECAQVIHTKYGKVVRKDSCYMSKSIQIAKTLQ